MFISYQLIIILMLNQGGNTDRRLVQHASQGMRMWCNFCFNVVPVAR
jgi:hypothetical protein